MKNTVEKHCSRAIFVSLESDLRKLEKITGKKPFHCVQAKPNSVLLGEGPA